MGLLNMMGHKYPFTDFHELNLDWCITAILQIQSAFEDFSAGNKINFANPLQHDLTKTYAKNTIVIDDRGTAYLSLEAVPVGVQLTDGIYWLPVFDFEGYISRANQNFTDNYFSGTDRTPKALSVGDWLVLDDILYKVIQAMSADDLFIIDENIEHFTVEQFLKDFVTAINATVQQYKDDIDASELAYRQQLAQDIAITTESLQAQLNLAISGATVDSEVINARLGADGVTYPTLGEAIRTQLSQVETFLSLSDLELIGDFTTTSDARGNNFNQTIEPGYYYEKVTLIDGYSIINNHPTTEVTPLNPIIRVSTKLTRFRIYVSPSAVAGINIKLYKLTPQQVRYLFDNPEPLKNESFFIEDFEQLMRNDNLVTNISHLTNRVSSIVRYEHGYINVGLSSYSTYKLSLQVFDLDTFERVYNSGFKTEDISYLVDEKKCFAVVIAKQDDSTINAADVPTDLLTVSADLYYSDRKPYSNYERLLIDEKIEANTGRIEVLESQLYAKNELLSRIRNEAPCYDHLYVVAGSQPIVPHESLYHVRMSKRMGFKVIEANVHSTSDGVFVVNHTNDGKFGNYFHHVDGETDISDISISSVTWAWIVDYVRYNSSTAKFRTRPCRLEEFLEECNTHNMIPLIQRSVNPSDVYDWTIAEEYMGDNYIAYGGSRDVVGDVPIFIWDTHSATIEEILSRCDSIGRPLIWGSTLSRFSDSDAKDIIETLHEHGYYVGVSYEDANWYKYRSMGADFNGTQTLINRIDIENICSCNSDFNWNDFTITGNPVDTNGVLTFTTGGTITPIVPEDIINYSGFDLEIVFEGTISITGPNSYSVSKTHDSMNPWQVARPVYTANPNVTITLSAGAVVRDIHFSASRF